MRPGQQESAAVLQGQHKRADWSAFPEGSEPGGVPRGPRGCADLAPDLDLDDLSRVEFGSEVLQPVQFSTRAVSGDLDVLGPGDRVRVAAHHGDGERP